MSARPKYVALHRQPRAWASDQEAMGERPTSVVHEADKTPEPTGLVDAAGTPLYRVTDQIKMGFVP